MPTQLRPIGTIAFASACLALTATGTIGPIGRKSVSVGTYKRVTVRQIREPCRLRAKRQENHRNLLRRVVPMRVRVSRISWRSAGAPNYQMKTLKSFMLSSWNGNGGGKADTADL
jgi:hypothetical protein